MLKDIYSTIFHCFKGGGDCGSLEVQGNRMIQSIENDFVSKLVLAQYTSLLIISFHLTSQLATQWP